MEAPHRQLPRHVPLSNECDPPKMPQSAKPDDIPTPAPAPAPAPATDPVITVHDPPPPPSNPLPPISPIRPPSPTVLHTPAESSNVHSPINVFSKADTSNAGDEHQTGEIQLGSSPPAAHQHASTAAELPPSSLHGTSDELPEPPTPASEPSLPMEQPTEDAGPTPPEAQGTETEEKGCQTSPPESSVDGPSPEPSLSDDQHASLDESRFKRPSPSFIERRSIAGRSYVSNMTPDDEALSLRVRSLYECGGVIMSDSSSQLSSEGGMRRISKIPEEGNTAHLRQHSLRNSYPGAERSESRLDELCPTARGQIAERPHSMYAGGAEDWEDLEGSEVDRYGFIDSPYIRSSAPAPPNPKTAPKRVATALFLQSEEPRKRTFRPLRLSPSAPEMLRIPANPRLLREKEDLRARKWRQMAIRRTKPDGTPETGKGGGAEWDFPVKDPKLIQRTWKGIPDCWRGAAWHSFLTASSKARGIGQSDNTLASIYHELLTLPCSDDVQIDLDVPRTISSHVLFRRRYRGGQRLLFRVLHSLALYFPHIGYVQGMASLAATLLCYYDEETAFIMLVRLWQLRGLEQLYEAGFGGLMTALDEFETKWMKNTVIQKKLKFLNINATAYGTRWYLTLFNYSIPFAAQLRIWDVFMLLGDPTPTSTSPTFFSLRSTTSLSSSRRNSASTTSYRTYNPSRPSSTMNTTNINRVNMHDPAPPLTTANTDLTTVRFNGTLDVLHATSAAILDGMKMIILKADFEEAMKNLTSFVPVRDEDMLMRVVKAEWKARRRRRW